MSLCLRGRLNPVLWSFDSIWWGGNHGLRAVCGASAQFVMVSNHGIAFRFGDTRVGEFSYSRFVIGLPLFVISGFLLMISRICVPPAFMIGIDMMSIFVT